MNKADYNIVLNHLKEEGIHLFGEVLDKAKASDLYNKITSERHFNEELFLTENEYLANPQHKGVNPVKGRNFIEKFSSEIDFLEQDPYLVSILNNVLGEGYTVFDKKFVCGIPHKWLPNWLKAKMENSPINNLGAYVKPQYRDITYFHGIDFHQDNIDWPKENGAVTAHELLTLYVYIHDVTERDAPLYVMPKSHKFGATVFPHNLQRKGNSNEWLYTDDEGRKMTCTHLTLTGQTGYVGLWHSSLLHGTQGIKHADESDNMRISMRYLLLRSKTATNTGLDEINASIDGKLELPTTRRDLDAQGKVAIQHNSIGKIKANDSY